MPTYAATRKGYAKLWQQAILTPARRAAAEKVARRILLNRGRYEAVAAKIGHPDIWPLIGALHDREAGGSFGGVLHNGEHIIGTGRKTRLVPPGRGPFSSWESAAVDALTMPAHAFHRIKDWPIERWLYEAERFNGWGYFGRIRSPYVWAGTTLQQRGKYVRDGVFDPGAWDSQLGVAAVLKAIFAINPSLEPEAIKPAVAPVIVSTTAGGAIATSAPVIAGSFDSALLVGAALAVAVIVVPWMWDALKAKGSAMIDTKSWTSSLGVWGGIIAIAAPALGGALGYTISADDARQVVEIGSGLVSAFGGLLAVVGRIRATKRVGAV